jgi:hypothetical protein
VQVISSVTNNATSRSLSLQPAALLLQLQLVMGMLQAAVLVLLLLLVVPPVLLLLLLLRPGQMAAYIHLQ